MFSLGSSELPDGLVQDLIPDLLAPDTNPSDLFSDRVDATNLAISPIADQVDMSILEWEALGSRARTLALVAPSPQALDSFTGESFPTTDPAVPIAEASVLRSEPSIDPLVGAAEGLQLNQVNQTLINSEDTLLREEPDVERVESSTDTQNSTLVADNFSLGDPLVQVQAAESVAVVAQDTELVLGAPDLVVSDIEVYGTATWGQQDVLISWTVTNQGEYSAAAPSAWDAQVYFSRDRKLDNSDTLLSPNRGTSQDANLLTGAGLYTPLRSGQSYTQFAKFDIPFSALNHPYIIVELDRENLQQESNENNNVSALEAIGAPNLVVSEAVTSNVTPGEYAQVFYEVTNDSEYPAYSDLREGQNDLFLWSDIVYLSSDTTFDPLEDISLALGSGGLHAGEVKPNGSYQNTNYVLVPENADPNSFLLLVADAYNQQTESSEQDNVRVVRIGEFPPPPPSELPDLVVTDLTVLKEQAGWGEIVPISWTVTNQGPGEVEFGNLKDTFYLSSDEFWDTDDTLLSRRSISSTYSQLAPGDSYTLQDALNIPVKPDKPYLIAVTDNGASVQEINENNNARTIKAFGAPDLAITDFQVLEESAAPVSRNSDIVNFYASVTVTNEGEHNANIEDFVGSVYDGKEIWFYTSSDDKLDQSDIRVEELDLFPNRAYQLSPGESYTLQTVLSIENRSFFYENKPYLLAIVDPVNRILELDEENNISVVDSVIPITFEPQPIGSDSGLPDLAIVDATALSLGGWGETIPVSYTISNQGTKNIDSNGSPGLTVYASNDRVFDPGIDIAVSSRSTVLNVGETQTSTYNFNIPYEAAGSRYLLLVIDPDEELTESDESNNFAIFDTRLNPVPDISPVADISGTNVRSHISTDRTATRPAHRCYSSDVELHSGAVIETHNLVSYQSQGATRGLQLRYNSMEADPRPIIHFGYSDVYRRPGQQQLLLAKLTVEKENGSEDVAGYQGGQYGLSGNEHFWSIFPNTSATPQQIDAALQLDLRDQKTGQYEYTLQRDIQVFDPSAPQFSPLSDSETGTVTIVNRINSTFGNGWSLTGLDEIVENEDGSVLLISNDGPPLLFEAPTTGTIYQSPSGDFSTLQRLANGRFRRGFKDRSVHIFGDNNHLIYSRDASGNITRYFYNADDQLTRITDPAGLITRFTYVNDRVSTIQDPANRLTKLHYDEFGNLTRVVDPGGAQRTWGYDDQGHMISEIDARGNREQSFYDFAGRAQQATRKDGSTRSVTPVQVQGLYQPTDTIDPFTAPIALRLDETDALNPEVVYTNESGQDTRTRLDRQGVAISNDDEIGSLGDIQRNDHGLPTQITSNRGDITTYTYDSRGNVTAIQDSLSQGQTNQLTYDPKFNQLTRIVNELGQETVIELDSTTGNVLSSARVVGELGGGNDQVTQYTYVDKDLVDTIRDPLGRITDFDYDASGRITQTIFAKGTVSEAIELYTYDLAGNQTTITDANGNVTEFIYNQRNQLTQVIEADPDGSGPLLSPTHTYTYDLAGNLVSEINGRGFETTYVYDELNRLTELTEPDPDGNGPLAAPVSKYFYDRVGNLIRSIDPLNNMTSYRYDARNRLTHVTDALMGVTQYRYDLDNNLIETVTPLGFKSTSRYDARNRLSLTEDHLGNQTQYAYNAINDLIQVTDANEHSTRYRYDALGRLSRVTDALGGETRYNYNRANNLALVTDPLNRKTRFLYDSRDRQRVRIDDHSRTTKTFDAVGNTIRVSNSIGVTQYTYDGLNRVTEVSDPLKQLTTYRYDDNGNQISIRDSLSNTTTYQYDGLDRLIEETDPLQKKTRYDYDLVGNLTQKTDRKGRRIQYGYDELNRQVTESWINAQGDPFHTFQYTFDKDSRLVQEKDPHSTYSYTYDPVNRVTAVDNLGTSGVPNVVLQYSYDKVGNRRSTTEVIDAEEQGRTDYFYDELNRVERITQRGDHVATKRVDFGYNKASQLTSLGRFSGISENVPSLTTSVYQYDSSGRLTNLTHRGLTNDVTADYQWTYDQGNRLIQLVSSDGVSQYQYDQSGQLTAVDHEAQADEGYTYDENGNRANAGYRTGANNLLRSDGIYDYTYDAERNLNSRTEIETGEVTRYIWDYRNRLVQIAVFNSDSERIKREFYRYDSLDRRIQVFSDSDGDGPAPLTRERFVYDGEDIALVFDGTQVKHRYLHGPGVDQALAQEDAEGTVLWGLTDNQGTVRDVVNRAGRVENHIVYDSYGNITSQTQPTAYFRFGYTGREYDASTGLYYYRARYYNPSVGRFINEDPLGFGAGDTNLSRYVSNSPTNYTDPSGNFSVSGLYNDFLTSDITYNVVNSADQFSAGFSDITSFGLTTKYREVRYGETATRNHQGGIFRTGQGFGVATSIALGAGAPSQLHGVALAQRFAQGHTVVGTGIGAFQSTRNILEGCGTPLDALSFAPLVGFGAKNLRGIGNVSGFLDDLQGVNNAPIFNSTEELAEIGIKVNRIRIGNNGKVAMIGRGMEQIKLKRDLLKAQGFNVEIFDKIPRSVRSQFEAALKADPNAAQLKRLDLFELNRQWAQKLRDQGYTVLDTGDPSNRFRENGFSVFYALEKSILF